VRPPIRISVHTCRSLRTDYQYNALLIIGETSISYTSTSQRLQWNVDYLSSSWIRLLHLAALRSRNQIGHRGRRVRTRLEKCGGHY
jgi:hypothetical protein